MTEDQELELVERLAEEFTERFRCGERPSIKEYAERYPELADIIRDTFQALALMEACPSSASVKRMAWVTT